MLGRYGKVQVFEVRKSRKRDTHKVSFVVDQGSTRIAGIESSIDLNNIAYLQIWSVG